MSDNQINDVDPDGNVELSNDTDNETPIVGNTSTEPVERMEESIDNVEDLNLTEVAPEPEMSLNEPAVIETPNIVVSNTDGNNPATNDPNGSEMIERPKTPELPPRSPIGSPTLPPRSPIVTNAAPHLPPRSPQMEAMAQPPNLPKRNDTARFSVPPPLSEEMKSAEFRKNAAEIANRSRSNSRIMSPIDSAAEINLIANRYRVTSHQLDEESESKRENLEEGQTLLKSTYTTILEHEKEGEEDEQPNEVEEGDFEGKEVVKIDWDFWTSVVNDFSTVANKESGKLEDEITKGIPRQIRGIIWQLIANSKSKEFEDIFVTLQDTESPHEASIKRDLGRTNFIPKEKVDALFNLLKVYSVYDPDVGYTQGMGFLTTPLLLNCETDADAFGLLITLMKNYGIREFFLPEMPGLMLLLYQFDRVLEENSPILFNHLAREGIKSSMYATQWFLTFFAYKFPLEFVLRIFDIVLFEGYESILKFAVNLLIKNQDILIGLKFEHLLNFLKNGLFEYYSNGSIESCNDNTSHTNLQAVKSNTVERNITATFEYNVDLFVKDAMNGIRITPISLHRYKEEYKEIHDIQQKKEIQYELFRIKNKQLQNESRKLHHEYAVLNKEHTTMANELIENRLKTETLLDENHDLKNTMEQIYQQIQEEKEKGEIPNPDSTLPVNLKKDLERTMERNIEVMNENEMLQEKIKQLELHVKELKSENKLSVKQGSATTRHSAEINNNNDDDNESPPVESSTAPSLSGGWKGFKNVFKKE